MLIVPHAFGGLSFYGLAAGLFPPALAPTCSWLAPS